MTGLGGRDEVDRDDSAVGRDCRILLPVAGVQAQTAPTASQVLAVSPDRDDATAQALAAQAGKPILTARGSLAAGRHSRYDPGPNAVRDCTATYVQEYRPSGTVITPRMTCYRRPGCSVRAPRRSVRADHDRRRSGRPGSPSSVGEMARAVPMPPKFRTLRRESRASSHITVPTLGVTASAARDIASLMRDEPLTGLLRENLQKIRR